MTAEATKPVLVAGGALVAPALALALARLRRRVVWLDSTPAGVSAASDPRPIALANASEQILRGLGIWPALKDATNPIETVHVSEAGHFGKLRLRATDCGVRALGQVVKAGQIAAALAGAVSEEPLITHVPEADRLRLAATPDGVAIEKIDAPGGAWNGAALIAADNHVGSIEGLPVTVKHSHYGQVALAATLTTSRAHGNVAYERFVRGGPLALLPLPNGNVGLVWTLPDDTAQTLLALDDKSFCCHLRSVFGGWLGDFSLASPRAFFPLALKESRIAQSGARVVLIGNAALQLHPVAGQGFNLALRDVATLADLLSDPATVPGEPDVLAAFDRARRADRRRVKLATHLGVQLYSSTHPLAVAARAPLLGLLAAVPGMSRRFGIAAMGLTPPLPRLARGAAL